MEKRKGVALISVLVLFAFISILAVGVLDVYLSSVKLKVNARTTDQLNYASMSGINIVSSYIINTNDEFLSKYNEFLSNNGNDRTESFDIPFSHENYDCVVSITSTYDENNDTGTMVAKTVYKLSSVARYNEQDSVPTTIEIEQETTGGNSVFSVGKFK